MCKYKGKLDETAKKFSSTDIWNDSCAEKELDYAIERGAVGATTNPSIVGNVIKQEMDIWEERIKKSILDNATFTEEEVAWDIIETMAHERAKKLLPIYEKYKGKKGRLSIQTNPKNYRNTEAMVQQAVHFNTLGENMQVKIPACKAGIKAMEELTYRGISINATISFTTAQAVAVAEAVEKGLNRRKEEGLPVDTMSPVCTIMIGRTDDWLKEVVKRDNLEIDAEYLEWAGIATMKNAYRIYKERDYTTRLLSAAYRNLNHWAELVGGDLAMTIPNKWQVKINECDLKVENRIDHNVDKNIVDELKKISEFNKSYEENGMEIDDFASYGGVKNTLSGFLDGYDSLLKVVRTYMIELGK